MANLRNARGDVLVEAHSRGPPSGHGVDKNYLVI